MATPSTRPKPYEGRENYIFVSYSHRDSARVFPLIQALNDRGFRVWYDEGIDPGTEWPESIANHLAGSKVCLAFVSPSSAQSINCRREINFTLARNKDFVSVLLEPTQMSPGMELQISTYQSLLSYKYPNAAEFVEKFCSLDILKPCQAPRPAPQPAPAPAPVPVAQPAAAAPAPTVSAAPAVVKTPAPPAQPSAPARPAKTKQPKPAKPARAPGEKKPLPKWLLAIPAALVLLVVLLVLNPFQKRAKLQGQTFKNESYLSVRDLTLSQDELAKLAKLNKCTTLSFQNCEFAPGALAKLAPLTGIGTFRLENCRGVDDLSWLGGLEKLYALNLKDCALGQDALAQFRAGERLSTLELCGCGLTALPDLSGAERLSTLLLANNDLTALPDLSGLAALTKLDLSGNQLQDLSPLSACKKLKSLKLADNGLTSIDALEDMIYLEELDLGGNQFSSIAPLSNCTILTTLRLSGSAGVTDLAPLSKTLATLTTLDLCGLSQADLGFLSQCTALTELDVNGCGLKDLSFAAAMPELKILNAAGNDLASTQGLSGCAALSALNLSDNAISDLTGLPKAPAGEKKPTLLLLLHNNAISDPSGLDAGWSYRALTLHGNPLSTSDALAALEGNQLSLEMSDRLNPESLKGFVDVHITQTVPDLQVAWEKTLGTKLCYTEPDEVIDTALKTITGTDRLILWPAQ